MCKKIKCSREMMKRALSLSITVIFLIFATLAYADEPVPGLTLLSGKFRICEPSRDCSKRDCTPSRDCAVPLDTRDCSTCLLRNLFGGCALRENDPVCEAAKAAQNRNYAATRATCEASKAAERLDCEVRRTQCNSEADIELRRCRELKESEIHLGNKIQDEITTKLFKVKSMPSKELPSKILDWQKLAIDEHDLKTIRIIDVNKTDFDALKWGPFKDPGEGNVSSHNIFPLGPYLVQLNGETANNSDVIRFIYWSYLFEKLGVDGVAQSLSVEPGTLEAYIETRVHQACQNNGC